MTQVVSSEKGDLFMREANKKSNASNGFICTTFGQETRRKEEAAELYIKAGVQYKIKKCYNLSGIAYRKGAEIYSSIDDAINSKQLWKECGKCFSHVDIKQSINAYSNAIQISLSCNRFKEAAKLQEEIAKMLLDNNDINQSIISYEKAAEFCEIEHDKSKQNKMLLMVAELTATEKKWEKAAKIFEDIAKQGVDHKLLKWIVKEQLFSAGLLRICQICYDDKIKITEKCNKMEIINEEYCDLSDIYCSSRESKLILNIINCLKKNDISTFKDLLNCYDNICKLNKWKIDMFHYILQFMKNTQNDQVICILLGDEEDDDEEKSFCRNNNEKQHNPFKTVLNANELDNAPDLENED